jgi:hypothetical protein
MPPGARSNREEPGHSLASPQDSDGVPSFGQKILSIARNEIESGAV